MEFWWTTQWPSRYLGLQGVLCGTAYVRILNVFLLGLRCAGSPRNFTGRREAAATFELCNTGVVRALVHGVYCVAGQRGRVRLLPP